MSNKTPTYIKSNEDPVRLQISDTVTNISSDIRLYTHPDWTEYHPSADLTTGGYSIHIDAYNYNKSNRTFLGSGGAYNETNGTFENGSFGDQSPYYFTFVIYLGKEGQGCSRYIYGPDLVNDQLTDANYISKEDLLAAGEIGVPLTEVLNTDNSEEENYPNFGAQEGTLYISGKYIKTESLKVLNKYYYWYYYDFTLTVRPNTQTDLITNIVADKSDNTTQNVDISPLLNHIGGTVDTSQELIMSEQNIVPLTDRENVSLPITESIYVSAELSFFPTQNDYDNWTNEIEISNMTVTNNTLVITLPELPMYYYASLGYFDVEQSTTFAYYPPYNDDSVFSISALQEATNEGNGIALMQYSQTTNTKTPVDDVKLFGTVTDNQNGTYTVNIWWEQIKNTYKTKNILTLQPSIDPVIDLSPVIDDCITDIKLKYMENSDLLSFSNGNNEGFYLVNSYQYTIDDTDISISSSNDEVEIDVGHDLEYLSSNRSYYSYRTRINLNTITSGTIIPLDKNIRYWEL